MNIIYLYIRNEENMNEHRTIIVPNDISELIKNNFIIYVQSSNTRIFKDEEYENAGAIITSKFWYEFDSKFIILGIKQFSNLEKLKNNIHIYFSHSYKNQKYSNIILESFKKSNSTLYDLEYFLDDNNKRLVAFGYYAGIVGCYLGLLNFYNKTNNINITELTYLDSYDVLIKNLENIINQKNIKIAIIGPTGRCGKGVETVLNDLKIKYDNFYKETCKNNLKNYDIVYNCILLNSYIEPWFTKDTVFEKNITIVDISCDYSNIYNPIKIYNKLTDWKNPIYSYNKYVDIIAIDNLPSLLPMESSIEFSKNVTELLKDFREDKNNYWKNNYKIYKKIIL